MKYGNIVINSVGQKLILILVVHHRVRRINRANGYICIWNCSFMAIPIYLSAVRIIHCMPLLFTLICQLLGGYVLGKGNLLYIIIYIYIYSGKVFWGHRNEIDIMGHTALALAIKLHRDDAILVLCDHFADPEYKPFPNIMSPLEMARAMKDRQLLSILITASNRCKQLDFDKYKQVIYIYNICRE